MSYVKLWLKTLLVQVCTTLHELLRIFPSIELADAFCQALYVYRGILATIWHCWTHLGFKFLKVGVKGGPYEVNLFIDKT